MRVIYSERFKRAFKPLPQNIKEKFAKQLKYLLKDFHYPSLHTKKISGYEGVLGSKS